VRRKRPVAACWRCGGYERAAVRLNVTATSAGAFWPAASLGGVVRVTTVDAGGPVSGSRGAAASNG